MERAHEDKKRMEFLKVKSFSGLELTKIEKGEETMTYGNFSLGKMSVEKLLGQIVLLSR